MVIPMFRKIRICLPMLFLLALSSCSNVQPSAHLIPQPSQLSYGDGSLSVQRLKNISFPDEWREAGEVLMSEWQEYAGLTMATSSADADIRVSKADTIAPEMYALNITEQGIVIAAGDVAGMNHAMATLLQLIIGADNGKLPLLAIEDKPCYGYRGVMIDCSRHFWTVDQLKKHIRQLALFKYNTLHLHLTDNQGWRLYVDAYPELADKGSYYPHYKELSGRYYSKKDISELIHYASLHGIEIIPEIDLPGHCVALLAAFPQLSCKGGKFETYPEEQDGKLKTRPGENMLCVGNPATYEFVDRLVAELAQVFPSRYLHLGGDEVSTHIWEQCPKCQALYRKENMASWHELQDYFTRRVSAIVRSHGKTMIGWDEINDRNAADSSDVIMVWQRDGKEQAQKALARGLQVILSPKDPCYLDFGYSRNATRRLYEWALPADSPLIKGGQANLWTEFVRTQEEVETMLYPRLCALAETLWSASEKNGWEDFRHRLTASENLFKRLKIAFFNDPDPDNIGFVPQTDSVPKLVRPAHVETNIGGIKYYLPEYVFDGDTRTFFATPYSLDKGNYFTLVLDEPQSVQRIEVVFDASKEHPEQVSLSISTDGTEFREIPSHMKGGILSADMDQPSSVKAVRIQLTADLMARLSIKEFILH